MLFKTVKKCENSKAVKTVKSSKNFWTDVHCLHLKTIFGEYVPNWKSAKFQNCKIAKCDSCAMHHHSVKFYKIFFELLKI